MHDPLQVARNGKRSLNRILFDRPNYKCPDASLICRIRTYGPLWFSDTIRTANNNVFFFFFIKDRTEKYNIYENICIESTRRLSIAVKRRGLPILPISLL